MLVDHGYFTLYKPLDPHLIFGTDPRVLYCCNEKGEDWYYIAEKEKQESRTREPHWYALVRSDGIVAAVEQEADRLWPNEFRLIETDYAIERGMRFTGESFEPGFELPLTAAQQHIARRNPSNAPPQPPVEEELPIAMPAEPEYPEPVIEEEKPVKDTSWSSILQRVGNDPINMQKLPIEGKVRMPAAFRSGAPEPPAEDVHAKSDEERRAEARQTIIKAVEEATHYADQVRYELALMAHNGNSNAVSGLEPEAAHKGLTVEELVEQIIQQRRVHERRVMFVHTIQSEFMTDIEHVAGEDIDTLVITALDRIHKGE